MKHVYEVSGAYMGSHDIDKIPKHFPKGAYFDEAPTKDVSVTKDDVVNEFHRRVALLINVNSSRTTYGEAIARRGELIIKLTALNARAAAGETLSVKDETVRQIITDGAIELDRLEDVSKALVAMSPIPDDYTDDKHWIKKLKWTS